MHSPLAIFKTHNQAAENCPLTIGSLPFDHYYQLISLFSMYVIPLTIILMCYARILMIVWRKTSAGTESAAAHERSIRQKRKTTRMVFIVVLLFGVCWAPIHALTLYLTWGLNGSKRYSDQFVNFLFVSQALSMCLCYSNSCVNPFIYAFTTTAFKKHFKKIFACWKIEDDETTEKNNDGTTAVYKKIGKYGDYASMKTHDTKV